MLFIGRLHSKCQLRFTQGIEHGTVKQPVELLRGQVKALPLGPSFLQLLTALQKQFRIVTLLRRQTGLRFDPAGQ